MRGQSTKYSYEFLRDLARSYDVRDRRFFNTQELQSEVDLIEPALPPEVVEEAHAKAALHVEKRRVQNKAVAQRMRARGYDTNQARNAKHGWKRKARAKEQ